MGLFDRFLGIKKDEISIEVSKPMSDFRKYKIESDEIFNKLYPLHLKGYLDYGYIPIYLIPNEFITISSIVPVESPNFYGFNVNYLDNVNHEVGDISFNFLMEDGFKDDDTLISCYKFIDNNRKANYHLEKILKHYDTPFKFFETGEFVRNLDFVVLKTDISDDPIEGYMRTDIDNESGFINGYYIATENGNKFKVTTHMNLHFIKGDGVYFSNTDVDSI